MIRKKDDLAITLRLNSMNKAEEESEKNGGSHWESNQGH